MCRYAARRFGLVLGAALLASTSAIPALAQTSRGTVTGIVTDASGAVVHGARAELTHTATGVARSSVTNEAGIYRFDAVDLGAYSLKISKPGFKVFLSTALGVEANRTTSLDATLAVGDSQTVVEVNADSAELLTRDAPLRGGNFHPQEVSRLPLIALNPISLARTLPGVAQTPGSFSYGIGGEATQFAVNGQRPRGNNYLLDGVDNNDIAFTGTAQLFNIADAVQEVSVQTGNFGVEFGRAGGGVFNVITKSGTNQAHATAFWQYRSQRFNSTSNLDKLNAAAKSVFTHNVYGFTLGGPLDKNKTFFFGAFQQDTLRSTGNFRFVLPTAEALARLRSLFPSNPRLDLYLSGMGELRGSAIPFPVALGRDPTTGMDRGSITFGSVSVGLPSRQGGPQGMVRFDHYLSEVHRLSFRYLFDSRTESPQAPGPIGPSDIVPFPGYIGALDSGNHSFLLADSYTISATWTNEFRFSYARTHGSQAISPDSVPLASTLPKIKLGDAISAPGIAGSWPQFRIANNWLFQETQSKLMGRHTLRYGFELLRQLAKQRGFFNERGTLTYTPATDFSSFANFLDDFSGPSGQAQRVFGQPVFYPDSFRQSYFLQDTWKARPSLTFTAGLRYENFGQPANVIKFPAFAGFDPNQFLVPNKVKPDNNNFGPAVGLAWSPSFQSGPLQKLLGDGKTAWRAGYQISYDAFFTQMLSFIVSDTPNSVLTTVPAPNAGRGLPNWSAQLPKVAKPPSLLDAQTSVFDKNIRNPYTERWSFGLQRELPNHVMLDLSYIGAGSHKLFTREDVNPRQLNGLRLHPDFGLRQIRTSKGNAIYHALQLHVDRRFAKGFQIAGSYTWSRNLDSTSESLFVSTNSGNQSGNQNLTSMPLSQGGLLLDRGLSDYHRSHRLTIAYLWDIPGPKQGAWKQAFGGWSIAGIATFQSGAPFTLQNGFDRNGDGNVNDRPDIANPSAPLNTRAVPAPGCPAGYRNPDTNACVAPSNVHFIAVGRGLPNGATVGRNTLFAGGTNNWDLNLSKTFAITETKRLEFRWEAFNLFNHPQFVNVPGRDVVNTPPGRFLNPDFTDGGIRTMRLQLKLIF